MTSRCVRVLKHPHSSPGRCLRLAHQALSTLAVFQLLKDTQLCPARGPGGLCAAVPSPGPGGLLPTVCIAVLPAGLRLPVASVSSSSQLQLIVVNAMHEEKSVLFRALSTRCHVFACLSPVSSVGAESTLLSSGSEHPAPCLCTALLNERMNEQMVPIGWVH